MINLPVPHCAELSGGSRAPSAVASDVVQNTQDMLSLH